jgi:hypothetical protein
MIKTLVEEPILSLRNRSDIGILECYFDSRGYRIAIRYNTEMGDLLSKAISGSKCGEMFLNCK